MGRWRAGRSPDYGHLLAAWALAHGEGSSIGLATMANTHDAQLACPVVYLVYDAVVANPDSPVAVRSSQFATVSRSWIVGENPQLRDHTAEHDGVEAPEAPFSGRFEKDGVHVRSMAARRGPRLTRHRPADSRSGRPTGCGIAADVRACAAVLAGRPGFQPAPATLRIRRYRESPPSVCRRGIPVRVFG